MDIKLSHKIIKDRCGTVSFKRGDSFYRTNKVVIESYKFNSCTAKVLGSENFTVTVVKDENSNFISKCSCPSLASIQTDCQHIAAVLISIFELQQKSSIPLEQNNLKDNQNSELTTSILNLFNERSIPTSGKLKHFEYREMIDIEFICEAFEVKNGFHLLGISIQVNKNRVKNLRDLLSHLKENKPFEISNQFVFDPIVHCIPNEADAILQYLIKVQDDEKMIMDSLNLKSKTVISEENIFLPPSYWDQIRDLLIKVEHVKIKENGMMYSGISTVNTLLPLHFSLDSINNQFYLSVKGIKSLTLLQEYSTVIVKGKFYNLNTEEINRLAELKQIVESSSDEKITISKDQIDQFVNRVIPGLRKLGKVQIQDRLLNQFSKTPLVAKLYLDRVKNRLLAGIDFQYDHIVINPLDHNDTNLDSTLIRDEEKELRILELMEEGCFSKTDGGYFLHNEELEYEFLRHIVPKLEKLMQIHATTAVRNRIFRESKKPKIRVKMNHERTNWLEFKFELDIPENQIKEVLSALKEKRKYYRLRDGTLFSLETKELQEIKRFLNAVPEQEIDYEQVLNLPIINSLHLLDSSEENNVIQYEESFHQFMDRIRHPEQLETEVPSKLQPILRDYQINGYKWMKTLASFGFGGILADDMGLGKTLQSITYIQSVLNEIRQKQNPILIVCPSSLTYNWLNEFVKFTPNIQAVVVDGNKTERMKIQNDRSLDVLITSYSLLRNDIKWYEKQKFHTVFFDEAQSFKNPFTQTAKSVKKINADQRFALTGTPIENSLEELWSIFYVIFPELFKSLKEFNHLTRKTIARRVRPFLLRRLKEEVLKELPEKLESMESVELHPEQKKLYAAYLAKLRHDTFKHLTNNKFTLGKNHIKILAGLTRLRQICCHPSLFIDGYKGSSAKFEQLFHIIEESKQSGRRVLIFSQFTKMLELIGRELAIRGLKFFYLDGQTASEERVSICNQFNSGERDFFLISLKAGGVGLNLTGADTVILYDNWWNPAVEKQAADRAYRFGQMNDVQVIKLIARGTIEEKMNELQEKKSSLIQEVIEQDGKKSISLTEDDIREILMI